MKFRSLLIVIYLFLLGFTFSLSANDYNFGDNELMLLVTADTLPKGSITLSNYELSLFNVTIGISKNTQIGVSGILPMFGERGGAYLCVKQRIINTRKLKIAAWGSGNASGFLAGGVASYGTEKTNVHMGVAVFSTFSDNLRNFFLTAGIRQKLSKNIFLIGEYYSKFKFKDLDKGVVLGGCRIRTKWILFDIGGFYGMKFDHDVLFWPYLKVSFLLKSH